MNRINVIGNLTSDPTERMAGEHKVASFTVAENSGSGDKKVTQFFRVTAWNKLADIVMGYAKKGTKVYVSGPLKFTVTEKDGKTYHNCEITRADDFMLLTSPDASAGSTAKPARQNANAYAEPEAPEDDNLPF